MKNSFDLILNKVVPKSTISNAEMLGAYCDRLLKTGSGDTLSDEQTEKLLKEIVQLFSYLQVCIFWDCETMFFWKYTFIKLLPRLPG